MTFIEKLRNRWHSANSLVCVGLDPDPARFPEAFIDDEDALFLGDVRAGGYTGAVTVGRDLYTTSLRPAT